MPFVRKTAELLLPWWLVILFRLDFLISMIQEMEYAQRLRRYNESSSWIVRAFFKKQLHAKLEEIKDSYIPAFERLAVFLRELGLSSSADQADRVAVRLSETSKIEGVEYTEMLQALLDRIGDETGRQQFFMVPPHRTTFYTEASKLFGESTNAAFPSAQPEIEHAAKCLAFGRNTASVFHLMRVMEVGLRVLGKSLNDPALDPKRNPSWEAILKRCDDQLKLPLKDRSPEWKTDDSFFSEAIANLRAVKNAWRNSTMHVERDYDEEEALDVMNAVKGYMRHLAGKLKER
jgi:hypothetical protein